MSKNHSQGQRIGFALSGMKAAWKMEASFRTEVLVCLGVIGWMLYAGFPLAAWLVASLSIAAILITELINTSIESVCDALHPEQHALIKVAKDCASGAVLLANFTGVLVVCALIYWSSIR